MKWYAKHQSKYDCFSYTLDWAGFNIPASVIKDVVYLGIKDHNKYDSAMIQVYHNGLTKYRDGNFYIIGAVGKAGPAMKHETAHGFFYTEPLYKKEMTKLVKDLKPSFRKSMYKTFKDIGYTPKVFIDECQAYLATGINGSFKVKLKNEAKPFIKVFNKYLDA